MPDQAETAIIKAAFKVISEDAGMRARFDPIRLTEGLIQLLAFSAGALAIAGFPVKPKDTPSSTSTIYVDLYVCPVIGFEETTADSELAGNTEFNELRKLLYANLPLKAADGSNLTDAVLDIAWQRTIYPPGYATTPGVRASGTRVPIFVARYQSKIDPSSGEFTS